MTEQAEVFAKMSVPEPVPVSLSNRGFLQVLPDADEKTNLRLVFLDLVRYGENIPNHGRADIMAKLFVDGNLIINEVFNEVDKLEEHRQPYPTTPLVWSLMLNKKWLVQNVEILLSLGANPDTCDQKSCGPLHYISVYDPVDEPTIRATQLLLENKANIMAKDIGGRTALHLAAFNGCCNLAELLINHGAIPSDKDVDGTTPLHAAAVRGHAPMVNLLMRNGVDVRTTDNKGRTAEDLAHTQSHKYVKSILAKEDARRSTFFLNTFCF